MNIATLLVALIATSAAGATGDPVLLDFQATWCGPCREMRPEVDKLVQKGYPVRAIDIDRSPELSDRYKVTAVPTFVIVDAKGKELARTSGAMPAARLASFYNEAKLKAADSSPNPVEEAQERGDSDQLPAAEAPPKDGQGPAPPANPRPWETVVRIKMHLSDSEWGFGSGTIIYSSAEESIILTCAHIFRLKGQRQPSAKDFRVPISIDLFNGQFVRRQPATLSCSEKDIPGEAIDYDFTNDVGLIRIRPGRKLPSSRVVPTYWHPQKGMNMVTVGCSHGQDATAWDTTILDARVGMSNTSTKQSFATIKCAHQPKEGRSGGGLFTSDGYVAGVCDFADPNEHVGLYAVPEAIHKLLDKNQLTALYKPPTNGGDVMLAANRTRAKASTGTRLRTQSPDESSNPDAVTLPPPNMVGVTTPPGDADAWRPRGGDRTVPRRPRQADPTEVALGDSGETRVRPGTARQTDLSVDPGPEARALDDSEAMAPVPPAPPKRSGNVTTSPSKPLTSGWRPVRQPISDSDGPRPSSR